MPSSADGGRTALVGFAYQALGTWALRARTGIRFRGEESDPDGDKLRTLLQIVDRGRLEHEGYDDASIQTGDEEGDKSVTLVQFKYSSQDHPPDIAEEALKKIARRLASSAQKAKDDGFDVRSFFLVSNRKLNRGAETLRVTARGEVIQGLDDKQRHALAELEVLDTITQSSWLDSLRRFACQHGAIGDEISAGVDRLVGNLLTRTAGGQDTSVTYADLLEAFTNYNGSKPLTTAAVALESGAALAALQSSLDLQGAPTPRSFLRELAEEAEQHAIVVLAGPGGSGKTVALWQWSREMVAAGPHRGGAFTMMQFADALPTSWVAGTACDWRHLPWNHAHRDEDPNKVLRRLESANPEGEVSRPLLHLALDGLDELGAVQHTLAALRSLIDWCWAEEKRIRGNAVLRPRMTLVVTCRDMHDFARRFLHLSRGGGDIPEDLMPARVMAGDFWEDELLAAAESVVDIRQVLGPALMTKAERVGREVGDFAPPRVLGGGRGAKRNVTQHDAPAILTDLLHPVVWGALLDLPAAQRERALVGDEGGMRELAAKVVKRFARKVIARGRVLLNEGDLQSVLQAIAERTHDDFDGATQSYSGGWRDAACAGTGSLLNRNEAYVLYQEALSGGLITEDSTLVWRWRHGLVRDYLASGAAHQGGSTAP